MAKKVIIYSTPQCPYCNSAKEYLKSLGQAYTEVNVAEDLDAAEEMIEKSGQIGVPVLDIDSKIVIGFDKEKIKLLVG